MCLIPAKQLTFLVEIGDFQFGNQKLRLTSSQHYANLTINCFRCCWIKVKDDEERSKLQLVQIGGVFSRVAKIIVWRESFQKVLKEERKGCS